MTDIRPQWADPLRKAPMTALRPAGRRRSGRRDVDPFVNVSVICAAQVGSTGVEDSATFNQGPLRDVRDVRVRVGGRKLCDSLNYSRPAG